MRSLALPLSPQRAVRVRLSWSARSIIGGLLVWEVAGHALHFPWLPPFTAVLAAAWELIATGQIIGNLITSLSALAMGVAVALIIGIPLGLMMGWYPAIGLTLDPYVDAMLASPTLAFVPIVFILFGLSPLTRILVVFLFAVFIVIINTESAVRQVDPALMEMAAVYGARRAQLFWKVVLPDALPLVMAGVRLGVVHGVKGMINGEIFIALVGLGAMVRSFGGQFDAVHVWAIVIVVVAVAQILSGAIRAIDHRLTGWAD
jgi:ABC-type nitrate/sulfonate/bicarbonate transport system permease component